MRQNPTWPPKISRSKGLLHRQIADTLVVAIAQHRFQAGDRLPPERELADAFGVHRLTVRQALAELQTRHLIDRRTGRKGGTFVAQPIIDLDLTAFAGFSEQVRRHGQVAGAKVLRAARVDADSSTIDALQLAAGSEVIVIDRLRYADDVPVVLEHSSFPAERFTGLLEEPLDGSLYDVLDQRFDSRPRRALEHIEPVSADSRTARLLDVARGTPLLRVDRVAFDAHGTAVESARDLLRGDRTRALVWSFDVRR